MTDTVRAAVPQRRSPAALLRNMPTGAKVFLILGAALLPLALLAFLASLQTTRVADQETRARLRVAASESARALSIELLGDIGALRVALDTLRGDPGNAPGCARLQGVFAQQFAAGVRFAVTDRGGRLLCGVPIDAGSIREPQESGTATATLLGERGLALRVRTEDGEAAATALLPATYLAEIAQPSDYLERFGSEILRDGEVVTLQGVPGGDAFGRMDSLRQPLEIDGLELEMTVRAAPITSALLIAMLLPFLMWAAAALIAWFVVDRLLIRPLRRLRATVGSYVPGTVLAAPPARAVPAQEIRELGETFARITETVRLHESDLAEGLVRQTKLTREVHHRVKNNLQVIASLINFHARGAESSDAAAAYASIQRRVDALAVVHRYHYAELEENRGVELRSVIGELASNIRAGAVDDGTLAITLDLDPVMVTQDVAVATAFLVTEIIELAMNARRPTAITMSLKAQDDGTATLRASSPSLVEGPEFERLLAQRYGRVIAGLARQLRAPLHHDPLVGSYEIRIPLHIEPN